MGDKEFLTHNQQMRHLRHNKKIDCSGSRAKEILCRTGYFNLVNGYKHSFIAGESPDGTHIYYRGTTIQEIYALKLFDDELRAILLKQITQVEEEVRTLAAYKFDEVNENGQITWYQIEAYSPRSSGVSTMKTISNAYRDVERSSQEYVRYYLDHHKFIPTWIMAKVISFSNFISFLNYSKDEVKQALCHIYGIVDASGRYDFSLLIGSLQWLRIVRNSCAHNERIYTMRSNDGRIKTPYLEELAPSYASGRDKRIMDLLVYLKYYCPHKEYVAFIKKVDQALRLLQKEIKPAAFNDVRAKLGIKDMSHLEKLCQNPKRINYNKLSKM